MHDRPVNGQRSSSGKAVYQSYGYSHDDYRSRRQPIPAAQGTYSSPARNKEKSDIVAQMNQMKAMMSSFFAQQGGPVPPVFLPEVVQDRDIAPTPTVSPVQEERIQADALSLADDNQSHFDDDASRSVDISFQPEDLKLVDVVRSCREIVGEESIPLPATTQESPGGLMASLLRASKREQVSLPQSGQFRTDAAALHSHVANTGHAGPLRPPSVGPNFFFVPTVPPIHRFNLSGAYRTHNESFSSATPMVEAELGKGSFTPFIEATEKLTRAMLSVSSALEVFSFSAMTKARDLIGEVPVELIRIQESAALAHLHLNHLISRSVANTMLAKRDIALKRCTVITDHYKEALRVVPFDSPYLCNNLPQHAREQMIKLGERPSFKRPAEVSNTSRPAKKAKQSGGRGAGQQQQQQQPQQPFRGRGGRGRGGSGRGRGRGRGQSHGAKPPPPPPSNDKK